MNKPEIKGIIFDMDGTLLDSMPTWDRVGSALLKRKGISKQTDIDEQMKGLGFEEALKYYSHKLNLGMTLEHMMIEINNIMREAYSESIDLKRGVKEVLQHLKERGYRMCIATATNTDIALIGLKRLGILEYFEFVISCMDVGAWKDQPKIYQESIKAMGLKEEEVVIIEDAGYCIQTAKKAGFKVVGIYDASAEADKDKIKEISDYYIEEIKELEEWL